MGMDEQDIKYFELLEELSELRIQISEVSSELSFLWIAEDHINVTKRNQELFLSTLTMEMSEPFPEESELAQRYSDVFFNLVNYILTFIAARDFLFNYSKDCLPSELRQIIHDEVAKWKKSPYHLIINSLRNRHTHGTSLQLGITAMERTAYDAKGKDFVINIEMYPEAIQGIKDKLRNEPEALEHFSRIVDKNAHSKEGFTSFLLDAQDSLVKLFKFAEDISKTHYSSAVQKYSDFNDRYEQVQSNIADIDKEILAQQSAGV